MIFIVLINRDLIFFVTIHGITRSVRSVEISYHDGSISHLKSITDDD